MAIIENAFRFNMIGRNGKEKQFLCIVRSFPLKESLFEATDSFSHKAISVYTSGGLLVVESTL